MHIRMSRQERRRVVCNQLADELRKLGQPAMSDAAREGHYSDYGSPLAAPKVTLAGELALIGTHNAMALRERVIRGEFDE